MVYEYQSDDMIFPNVKFSEDKLEISGESYMENPFEFYLPILKMLKEQISEKSNFTFNCKLTYTNTASNKCMYQILDTIKFNIDKGKNININWYYDDDDLLEEIEDLEQSLKLNINKLNY